MQVELVETMVVNGCCKQKPGIVIPGLFHDLLTNYQA